MGGSLGTRRQPARDVHEDWLPAVPRRDRQFGLPASSRGTHASDWRALIGNGPAIQLVRTPSTDQQEQRRRQLATTFVGWYYQRQIDRLRDQVRSLQGKCAALQRTCTVQSEQIEELRTLFLRLQTTMVSSGSGSSLSGAAVTEAPYLVLPDRSASLLALAEEAAQSSASRIDDVEAWAQRLADDLARATD